MTAREQAMYSPQHGTDREMLAEMLGVPAETADTILERYGGMAGLMTADPDDLCRIPGIGPATVARLRAGVEIARRMLAAVERAARQRIGSSADVVELAAPRLRGLQQERCEILLLNGGNDVVALETISEGSLTESPVYPRDLVTRANRHHAAAFILIHNHPSGNCQPSAGDRKLTQDLVLAGDLLRLPLVDHVIIGAREHFSFADHGLIEDYRRRSRRDQ